MKTKRNGKLKLSKKEKQQRRLDKVMALPVEMRAQKAVDFWFADVPARFIPVLGGEVIKEIEEITKRKIGQRRQPVLAQPCAPTDDAPGPSDEQMKSAVNAMNYAFLDPGSGLTIARDQIILDLFSQWMASREIFSVVPDENSFDSSTAARGTGVKPSLTMVHHLHSWLEMATGRVVATHISGYGRRAETWQDLAQEQIEELMDNFFYEYLGDSISGNDWETIPELRAKAMELPDCNIGQSWETDGDPTCCDGWPSGYLGRVGQLSIQQFAKTVDLDLLGAYPFLGSIHQQLIMERDTPVVNRSGPAPRL